MNLELVNELWLPNIFIYNLKTFKVVEVLSKHAGLWVTKNHDVFYSQATHITFICPMRFDSFPLDTQVSFMPTSFDMPPPPSDDSHFVPMGEQLNTTENNCWGLMELAKKDYP